MKLFVFGKLKCISKKIDYFLLFAYLVSFRGTSVLRGGEVGEGEEGGGVLKGESKTNGSQRV